MKKLVSECFAQKKGKFYIFQTIQRAVRLEMKTLSTTESILCSQSLDILKTFSWSMIYKELETKAPVLLGLLLSATHTRVIHRNREAIVCICAALLLKYRFKRLNLFQKVLGITFYASSCSKKVNLILLSCVCKELTLCRYFLGCVQ